MAKVYQVADPSFGSESHVFPDEYSLVATVDSENLDKVFTLTNTIDHPWWNNEGVTKEFVGEGCRSTSVGDVVIREDGTKYICESIGWSEITDQEG